MTTMHTQDTVTVNRSDLLDALVELQLDRTYAILHRVKALAFAHYGPDCPLVETMDTWMDPDLGGPWHEGVDDAVYNRLSPESADMLTQIGILLPRLRTHSQNRTVAARAIADRKTVGHRS
jgi:hypothetical protein